MIKKKGNYLSLLSIFGICPDRTMDDTDDIQQYPSGNDPRVTPDNPYLDHLKTLLPLLKRLTEVTMTTYPKW